MSGPIELSSCFFQYKNYSTTLWTYTSSNLWVVPSLEIELEKFLSNCRRLSYFSSRIGMYVWLISSTMLFRQSDVDSEMLYPSLKLLGFISCSILRTTTIRRLGLRGKSSSGKTGLSSEWNENYFCRVCTESRWQEWSWMWGSLQAFRFIVALKVRPRGWGDFPHT